MEVSSGYSASETKRNYRLLVAEGILFTVGLVFFDPNTILPLLVERLTGSAILIGIVGAVQPLSKGFIPILAGNWISSMPRKKRFLVGAMSVGRLPLWPLAAALIWLPASPAWLWATLLLSVQVLFWFGDSAGDPAWMDMVGKSVPDSRRGRFFATRQVVGGLLSVAAGAVVAALLGWSALPFPVNYGLVVLIGAVIYLGNVGTFVGLVERPTETSKRLRLTELVRSLPHYLKANPSFSLTMVVLVLFNMGRISLPFYIVYGGREFGLAEAALGLFIPLQVVGRISGALLWGYLGDRYGHQRAIKSVSFMVIVPALIALLTGLAGVESTALFWFSLLFFLLGFALEGAPPFINYMLAIVPERERPLYAGLMGVGYVPAVLAPIAGGLLIQFWTYSGVFALTFGLTTAGFLVALLLPSEERMVAIRD
jgi:MFS family permease